MKHAWNLLNRWLARVAPALVTPLVLAIRLYWGWQFFVTGKGKLFYLERTAGFFGELGLPLPKLQAALAGTTECLGGLLLLAGLFSRPVCLPLGFTMIIAFLTAHRETVTGLLRDPDAFVTAPPFLFLFAVVIVFVFGPGAISADRWIQKRTE